MDPAMRWEPAISTTPGRSPGAILHLGEVNRNNSWKRKENAFDRNTEI